MYVKIDTILERAVNSGTHLADEHGMLNFGPTDHHKNKKQGVVLMFLCKVQQMNDISNVFIIKSVL